MRRTDLSRLHRSLFHLVLLLWATGSGTAWSRLGWSSSPGRVTHCMPLVKPTPVGRFRCQANDAYEAPTHSGHDTLVVERASRSERAPEHLEYNATLEVSPAASEDNAPIEVDPVAAAIEARESELRERLSELEVDIRQARLVLSRLHDQVSESGKPGFYLIKAQVNDFLRSKAEEQKAMVSENKRDFVEKMVPIVQLFQQAPYEVPASTERERAMHENFGALLNSIVGVIEKYGFKHLLEERTKEQDGKDEVSGAEEDGPSILVDAAPPIEGQSGECDRIS